MLLWILLPVMDCLDLWPHSLPHRTSLLTMRYICRRTILSRRKAWPRKNIFRVRAAGAAFCQQYNANDDYRRCGDRTTKHHTALRLFFLLFSDSLYRSIWLVRESSRRLLPDGAVRLIIPHHVVLLRYKRKGDDDNVRHRPSLKGSQLIYSAFSFFFLL